MWKLASALVVFLLAACGDSPTEPRTITLSEENCTVIDDYPLTFECQTDDGVVHLTVD